MKFDHKSVFYLNLTTIKITGLDGLGEGILDSWLNRGENGDIVAGLLGSLFTVVVAIAVVSISWSWLVNIHDLFYWDSNILTDCVKSRGTLQQI